MELQVGVKILLMNNEGKFLFLLRNPEKYPEVKKGELLDIVGGRIQTGVSLLENLKREIFEETKLSLAGEPKLIVAQDILRPDKHVVRLTYVGRIEGDPILDEDHVAYKWLSREAALKEEGLDQYARQVLSTMDF